MQEGRIIILLRVFDGIQLDQRIGFVAWILLYVDDFIVVDEKHIIERFFAGFRRFFLLRELFGNGRYVLAFHDVYFCRTLALALDID